MVIKNRKLIPIIIIASILLIAIIVNGLYWHIKCKHTMEMLGSALINQDIDMMDELFAQECSIRTNDGKYSTYSAQRSIIEEMWNTYDYQSTSYNYRLLGFGFEYFLSFSIQYTFEMRIVDSNGDKYRLDMVLVITRKNISDSAITYASANVYKNPIR